MKIGIARPPGCPRPRHFLVGKCGNVLELQTCRVCTQVALDSLRGAEYACASEKGVDADKLVLLKQKEFFSLQAYKAKTR